MSEKLLGTEKISTLFIKYSIPAIISMVIAGIQPIIDGIFLGNIEGTNALASVNLAQPLIQGIIGLSMIICVGSLSYMGRSLGEGNKKKAQDIFKTAVISIISLSVATSVVCVIFSRNIALTLGANAVLVDGVTIYVRIISVFVSMIGLGFLFGFTARLIGRPELQMKGAIFSLLVNIILDFLLIKVFHMGLMGAALATGIAFISVFVFVMAPMFNRSNSVNLFEGKFDARIIPPVVYNGSSEGVVSVAIALSIFVFNLVFMARAGEIGVAAFTTINYISQLAIFIMLGISDGINPMLSYNYGYQKYERLKSTLKLAAKVNLAVGTILFMLLFFFGPQLVSLFVRDNPAVTEMAVVGSKLYAFAFFFSVINIMNSGYFTAIGRAGTSIIISASRGIVLILLGVRFLPMMLGIRGIWITVPLAESITLLIGGFLLWKNFREQKSEKDKKELVI
jgi:putative MATE family efflux protein